MIHEKPLPGIAHVSGFIRWVLVMVSTISELFLVAAIVVMVANDVTGGSVFKTMPWLVAVYGWGQAIGIEGQLVSLAVESRKLFMRSKNIAGFLIGILVLALASITFIAVGIANYTQTFDSTIPQALLYLGITDQSWVWLRAGILVTVAVVGAYMLYIPEKLLSDAEVERQIEQEQLRAKLSKAKAAASADVMAARVNAWKQTGKQALGIPDKVDVEEASEPDQDAENTDNSSDQGNTSNITQITSIRRKSKNRKKKGRNVTPTDEAQDRIRAYLLSKRGASNNEIATACGLSTSTVARHKAKILAEIEAAI